MEEREHVGKVVLDAAFAVHTELGPGLLESTYEACLAYELGKRDLVVKRQLPLPVCYRDIELDAGYRLDSVVNDCVIVELKVVDSFSPVHMSQILTYLKLSGFCLGYLLNFNVRSMKEGIRRVVHNIN